jgi:uncharacterized Tic20 family protein
VAGPWHSVEQSAKHTGQRVPAVFVVRCRTVRGRPGVPTLARMTDNPDVPPPPPPGQEPPAWGQPGGPPPYGTPPPAGPLTPDERTWVLIAHLGGAAVAFLAGGTMGWVVPLVAMLAKGGESPRIRANAVEALNFQLTWSVATVIAYVLAVCSFGALFFLPILTIAVAVIFGIVAGVKAGEQGFYRYPMTVRMVT